MSSLCVLLYVSTLPVTICESGCTQLIFIQSRQRIILSRERTKYPLVLDDFQSVYQGAMNKHLLYITVEYTDIITLLYCYISCMGIALCL